MDQEDWEDDFIFSNRDILDGDDDDDDDDDPHDDLNQLDDLDHRDILTLDRKLSLKPRNSIESSLHSSSSSSFNHCYSSPTTSIDDDGRGAHVVDDDDDDFFQDIHLPQNINLHSRLLQNLNKPDDLDASEDLDLSQDIKLSPSRIQNSLLKRASAKKPRSSAPAKFTPAPPIRSVHRRGSLSSIPCEPPQSPSKNTQPTLRNAKSTYNLSQSRLTAPTASSLAKSKPPKTRAPSFSIPAARVAMPSTAKLLTRPKNLKNLKLNSNSHSQSNSNSHSNSIWGDGSELELFADLENEQERERVNGSGDEYSTIKAQPPNTLTRCSSPSSTSSIRGQRMQVQMHRPATVRQRPSLFNTFADTRDTRESITSTQTQTDAHAHRTTKPQPQPPPTISLLQRHTHTQAIDSHAHSRSNSPTTIPNLHSHSTATAPTLSSEAKRRERVLSPSYAHIQVQMQQHQQQQRSLSPNSNSKSRNNLNAHAHAHAPRTRKTLRKSHRPTLIKQLGKEEVRIVGDMKYDPLTRKWDGNHYEPALRELERAKERESGGGSKGGSEGISVRPALITHFGANRSRSNTNNTSNTNNVHDNAHSIDGKSTTSDTPLNTSHSKPHSTSYLNQPTKVVGDMVFDPVRMCWLTNAHDDEDVFANLSSSSSSSRGSQQVRDQTAMTVLHREGEVDAANGQAAPTTSSTASTTPTPNTPHTPHTPSFDTQRKNIKAIIPPQLIEESDHSEETHKYAVHGWVPRGGIVDDRRYLYEIYVMSKKIAARR
ncbi:hypothetical protein E3P81_00928 [Wallemia ichthyophaga]|nr:hypothetical protein E3P97_00929 [Wallemia ichthyophaga]TIB34807.1 hypothetical protein E3P85_00783 [Wallemia ichthyophaga]TIB49267.1 hypothetical protein E3P82_00926 [Wallemia ichthyophaga]TIB53177.1 hypothetical protein E3P81_00928 [Wallemia ichthyophaga]TIB55916.1 hypothetical protein E3P80_00927 [Wallemia ichthyophaga]